MHFRSDFLWYDLETFGEDPWRDRIAQFAAIRTNFDFEILEQHNLYCKPPLDRLPKPEAAFITGITPQFAMKQGLSEPEFACQLYNIMEQGNCCRVGYNSIRFDDEACRSLFYRNFYDPYSCEWQSGNSRWDLLDVVRLVFATRPEAMQWPQDSEGKTLFKLEKLAQINNLTHKNPHEAMSDILATIALAKYIREREPKLFDFCWEIRKKNTLLNYITKWKKSAYLHISGRYPSTLGCATLVTTLCQHPNIKTHFLVADLRIDPTPWLGADRDLLQQCLYSTTAELQDLELQRLPVKTINTSHCPIIATAKLVNDKVCAHIKIDKNSCEQHREIWHSEEARPLVANLQYILAQPFASADTDAETSLYNKFIADSDKRQFSSIHRGQFAEMWLKDGRLRQLLLRYKAQHFTEQLTTEEQTEWRHFCRDNLSGKRHKMLSYKDYCQTLENLRLSADKKQSDILNNLEKWGLHLNDLSEKK